MTASDQAAAAARIESLPARQANAVTVRLRCLFFVLKGLEGRAVQSNKVFENSDKSIAMVLHIKDNVYTNQFRILIRVSKVKSIIN